jgi:hypothetical protein
MNQSTKPTKSCNGSPIVIFNDNFLIDSLTKIANLAFTFGVAMADEPDEILKHNIIHSIVSSKSNALAKMITDRLAVLDKTKITGPCHITNDDPLILKQSVEEFFGVPEKLKVLLEALNNPFPIKDEDRVMPEKPVKKDKKPKIPRMQKNKTRKYTKKD